MIDPGLVIIFAGGRRIFEPGDAVTIEYRYDAPRHVEARALEASIVWYTVGKGDEDIGVHHFVRHATDDGQPFDCRKPHYLKTVLPPCPLSYDGVIVKIRWCVRVRLFPQHGRELSAELPFQLGRVPAAPRPIATASMTDEDGE